MRLRTDLTFNTVTSSDAKIGDAVRFASTGTEHLGLAVPDGVLHAHEKRGVIISPVTRLDLAGVYRLRVLPL